MKKLAVTAAIVLALGAIIAVLLGNKAEIDARAKNDAPSAFPVSTLAVGKQKMTERLSLVGTVTANNDVAVVSETQGRITAVLAQIGDHKQAGEILIHIDDELKQANLASAEVHYQKAKKDLDRFETLHHEGIVPDAQLESARQAFTAAEAQYIVARRQLRDTQVTTPISGVITARPVDVGTMVTPGTVVANVVDLAVLKVRLNVAERDAFRLKVGDPVKIATQIYPGAAFEGRIKSISAKADEAHTYPVEITLPNSKIRPLKAGMFARVSFISIPQEEVLALPREALVGSIRKPQVYVVENGLAALRDIVIGADSGTVLEVREGLTEGETVVVAGQNNLKDKVPVTVIGPGGAQPIGNPGGRP
ncbi:MAG: efflux RND transporter periplasmic adaptor subunit [Candidatus Manganitrophaceae bacterium]|nr:MAG: efflux RND transporter periplasmic adaptor subunit [Candidatus Manganitrophaceae bacterium]